MKEVSRPRRFDADKPGGRFGGMLVTRTAPARVKTFSPLLPRSNPLMRRKSVDRTMSDVTIILDRETAEQLVKRVKNPYHVRMSETVFQRLLVALEAALQGS